MTFEYVCTRNNLADLLEIPHGKLTYVLYVAKVDSFYKIFEIPKKSGETRKICAPTGDLKQIQEKLYSILLHHQQFLRKQNNIRTNISHAFEKGKSIITNGEVHRNKRIVVNIDLQDFFDSFHFGRVCGFFEKNRDFALPHELAIVMAQLTCYQGKLPQGAPTSPIITNYICQTFDMRIIRIAKKYHLDYTRYADDLSFSTNDKKFIEQWEPFYNELTHEVERAGFKVNTKKTSVQYRDSRQTVTGLVINKKLSVDHRYYKQVKKNKRLFEGKGCHTIEAKTDELLKWVAENVDRKDSPIVRGQLSGKLKKYKVPSLTQVPSVPAKDFFQQGVTDWYPILTGETVERDLISEVENIALTDKTVIISGGRYTGKTTALMQLARKVDAQNKLYVESLTSDEALLFHLKLSQRMQNL